MGYTRLQTEPFGIDGVLDELRRDPRTGGVTFYVGTVRGDDDGRKVDALTYEAYPEMAEKVLDHLRRETIQRFRLVDATVIHRLGAMKAGQPILLVALAGAHRAETYDAIRYFMDRLKEDVPIWKREESADGPTWILGNERRRVEAP